MNCVFMNWMSFIEEEEEEEEEQEEQEEQEEEEEQQQQQQQEVGYHPHGTLRSLRHTHTYGSSISHNHLCHACLPNLVIKKGANNPKAVSGNPKLSPWNVSGT